MKSKVIYWVTIQRKDGEVEIYTCDDYEIDDKYVYLDCGEIEHRIMLDSIYKISSREELVVE
jgi:hypothetical protein